MAVEIYNIFIIISIIDNVLWILVLWEGNLCGCNFNGRGL